MSDETKNGETINEPADSANSQNAEGKTQTILWKGHPSYLAYVSFYIFGVIFIVLGSLYSFFSAWAIALGVFLIFISIMDRNSKVYAITDTSIIARANMHRYNVEVLFTKITSVELQRHFAEKLFGMGTVRIAAQVEGKGDVEIEIDKIAAQVKDKENVKIEFRWIRNWREIMQQIEELRAKQ